MVLLWVSSKFKGVATKRSPFSLSFRDSNGGFQLHDDEGSVTPCQVRGRGGGSVEVSHLLFTDDTLIFCRASKDQMTHLCWLLMWFEAISGLKIIWIKVKRF